MKNSKDVKLLNVANEHGLLPLIFAELVSGDALVNEVACDKSIEVITNFLEAIDDTDIQDKDKWKKFLEDGLEIAKRDKEKFAEEKSAKEGDN